MEELAGLLQKRLDMGIQRAQVLAQAGQVELLARFLDGLAIEVPTLPPSVRSRLEQSDRRPAQMHGMYL